MRLIDSRTRLVLTDTCSKDLETGMPGHLEEDWLESQIMCLLKCSVSFST